MATLQDLYTVARRLTVEMRGGLVGVHASRATHEYVDIVLLVGVALKPSSRIGFDPVSDHCPPSLPPVHLVLFCAGKTRGAEARGTIKPAPVYRAQHTKLRELSKVTQQIESQWRILVVQENASKRDLWKRKVEQVVEDCDQFRVALDRFKGRVSVQ